MNPAAAQLIAFTAARALSAGLSFLLFAYIAGRLEPSASKDVFFVLFPLGFVVAALRTLTNVSAQLNPLSSKAEKLRIIYKTLRHSRNAQLLAVMTTLLILRSRNIAWPVVLAGGVAVGFTGWDYDIFRAVVRRPPLFPAHMAAGNLLALGTALSVPSSSVAWNIFAMLLQWLPSSISATYFYARARPKIQSIRSIGTGESGRLIGIAFLFVSTFDGIVLNAPYFFGAWINADTGLELAVITRLFVSSLVMGPLLLHWSNSGILQQLSERVGLSEKSSYLAIFLASAASTVVFLSFAYQAISKSAVSHGEFAASLVLAVGYAIYATGIRYRPYRMSGLPLAGFLLPFLVFYSVTAFIAVRQEQSGVIIALWQALSLGGTGLALLRVKEQQ